MRKSLIVFATLLLSGVLQAQLPTAGLVAQYDMLTAVSTSLTDLSGNGNNGTIVGTTTTAQGRVCNGSSDYVSMPLLIANSDFTVIVAATGNNPSTGGATWGESNASASQFVRFGTSAGTWTALKGNSATTNLTVTVPDKRPDWDMFFASRSQSQISGGMLSRANATQTAVNAVLGTVTVSGGGAAICALNEGASRVNFWAGTIGYFVLYNRHLSTTELQAAYVAVATAVYSRSVFVHPWPPSVLPVYTNPVWQRQGVVFSLATSGAGFTTGEPLALYDTTCPQLSISTCFRLWYSTAGETTIGYAESPDGFKWTNHGAAGSSVLTSCVAASVLKVASTYHMYCGRAQNTGPIDHYTSPDGITWTIADSGVIALGSAAAWDDLGVANASVQYSPDGSGTWYMLYGGDSDGTGIWTGFGGWRTGGATSPDGHTWTKLAANPTIGQADVFYPSHAGFACCGNPNFFYINGGWWDWDGSYGIVRFASPVFNGLWIWSQPHASLLEASADESNQLADPSLLQAACPSAINSVTGSQCTFMFYTSYSTNSVGTSVIKLAIANMPMSQLVTTAEGATTDWP
jgi:hypothetical protein